MCIAEQARLSRSHPVPPLHLLPRHAASADDDPRPPISLQRRLKATTKCRLNIPDLDGQCCCNKSIAQFTKGIAIAMSSKGLYKLVTVNKSPERAWRLIE